MCAILDIKQLSIEFQTQNQVIQAVKNLSLRLFEGETLAIVGESGCGKSVLCKSILNLLPHQHCRCSGEIQYQGKNLLALSEKQLTQIRGKEIAMIFQNPASALNPTIPVGKQLVETIRVHQKISPVQAKQLVFALLEQVGLKSECAIQYPYEFSGGMLQRIAIAAALMTNPRLFIADEPTTALDTVTQKQILELIQNVKKQHGCSVLLISHHLGIVSQMADRIAVMYAGKIVEIGTTSEILYHACHPYTWLLLSCLPNVNSSYPISYHNDTISKGDAFAPYNPYALRIDFEKEPPFFQLSDTHYAATWLLHPDAPKVSSPIISIE